ncbi:MAG: glycosyltransferase [Synergistaceae bacterium]|nr:glycosyltransferase [Synergistaceae bacterium]
MPPVIAVVIPTKNRGEAVEKYALASLARSSFRDFVCVIWDASDDDLTSDLVKGRSWGFDIQYFKAPRKGLTSQRNDAVRHVLSAFPGVKHVVFMDDDSELSKDALSGVAETFEKQNALLVNIPVKAPTPFSWRARLSLAMKRLLGMNRHGATSFLYNYGGEDEPAGCNADWAGGCGMGVDVSVFRDMRVFFPEEFQRFGGYALGEDLAFSLYVSKKLGGRLINSLRGHLYHHVTGPPRLNIQNMAASKWYNFHLLFDAIYVDGEQKRPPKLRFKLFMAAAALKLLVRARSFDLPSVLRGISEARAALRRYRSENDISSLMRPRWDAGREVK